MRQRTWALLLLALVAAGAQAGLAGARGPPGDREFIDAFERRLLAMFGLHTRPRPKRSTAVSDYMWELYEKQSRHRLQGTETVRCFRAEEEDFEEEDSSTRYSFDLNGLEKTEKVRAAELVVPRERVMAAIANKSAKSVHRLSVYDVLRPSTLRDSEPILRILDSHILKNVSDEWIVLDVLPAIHRWRRNPSRNHGLHIQLSSTCPSAQRVKDDPPMMVSFEPLLVTYSRESRDSYSGHTVSRTKRSAATRKGHRRKGRRDSCRRHALFVDFSDVGWNDWIIAPPGYDAYFCHGDCPYPLADHHNTTNHAIVQTLVNSVNPTAVPRACCVPTELSSISMLYKDKYDNVVLKNYKDMVVEGCGCR